MKDLVVRAFKAYGFDATDIAEPQTGYRNTSYASNNRNLIIYKNESDIQARVQRANYLGDLLARRNLPTRTTIDARILTMRSPNVVRYASLYNYLPGTTIPWEGYTKHHIKLLGMAMGKIHTATNNASVTSYPSVAQEYIAICERMQTYFATSGVARAMVSKLKVEILNFSYIELLIKLDRLPDQQLLHMDLVRGNVLFRDASSGATMADGPVELCGILDFEKAAIGHPAFDLARTYAFLLVDCKYKTADKIVKYFFYSGYAKRGGGIYYRADEPTIYALTSMFLLYDFYKFLKHNPYESLAENEHYVRTRDILIARKMAKSV